MAKLELRNIRKNFGEVVALCDLSLSISESEFLVLLGPSGCGKTTTLRLIAGFLRPDEGQIIIANVEVSSSDKFLPPNKRGLAMVFQSYALWPHKNVFQNVAYGLKIAKVPKAEIKTRTMEALDTVQLKGLAGRYPTALSGGQQQRVSLARALVVRPSVMLLDEPLSNLDAKLREEMRFELKELQKKLGITFIYVTHDQSEAIVLADKIVVMNQGIIEQIGSPQEIYNVPRTEFVASFIGNTNLIPGEIMTLDEGSQTVTVRNDSIGLIKVSNISGLPSSFSPNEQVFVTIRPEDILISKSQPQADGNVFSGKVVKSTYLGPFTDYRVEINGINIRIQAHIAEVHGVTDTSYVYLDPSKCILIEKGKSA